MFVYSKDDAKKIVVWTMGKFECQRRYAKIVTILFEYSTMIYFSWAIRPPYFIMVFFF
jgi:hypothetical protein